MSSPIEFFVEAVLQSANGESTVAGVPNNGVALKLGDTFVLKFEVPKEDARKHPSQRSRVNLAEIELTVHRIERYRQLVDQLPAGTTGCLSLVGRGLDQLTGECFLHTRAEAT